jgi:hypothetical protein
VLCAYDPTNLQNELYNSSDSGTRDHAGGAVKFTVPTIADGLVFGGGEYALAIYGLLAGVTNPAAPSNLVAQPLAANQISVSWQNNSASGSGFTLERCTDGTNFKAVASIRPYADRPGGHEHGSGRAVPRVRKLPCPDRDFVQPERRQS